MGPPTEGDRQREQLIARLKIFRDRLLQVDWRNRSILLRRIHKRWSYDVAAAGAPSPSAASEAVGKALSGGGRVCLVLDSDESAGAGAARDSLTQLSRSLRLIFEESGIQDCYLGFPFLVGHLEPGRFVRAPLVLFPANLEHVRGQRGAGWYLTLPSGEAPILNRALFAAMRNVRGFDFASDLDDVIGVLMADATAADAGEVLANFLAKLQGTVRNAGIPLSATPLTTGGAVALDPLSAEQLAALPPTQLRLDLHLVLGSFPQGSTAIYADYGALIARASGGETNLGIVDDLLEAAAPVAPTQPAEEAHPIDGMPDRLLNFALPTDGSQEAVIVGAQFSDCVVVRGPPGTGKSQVIVNLITQALSVGERVLVVCQKRAALDVVFQRLERAGLSEAAVLLHDPRADRVPQYRRLAARMSGPPPAPDERAARELEETSNLIDRTIAELNALVAPLWKEAFGGVRPCELYAAASPGYRPRLDIAIDVNQLTVRDLKEVLAALPKLEEGYRRFDGPEGALSVRRPFEALANSDRPRIDAALGGALDAAVAGALLVPGEAERGASLAKARDYLELRPKPWKVLLPRWWTVKGAVEALLSTHAGDARTESPEALVRSLEAGVRLGDALRALAPWLTSAGNEELVSLAANPRGLSDRLGKMRAALSEFEAICEHDKRRAALSANASALYRACADGLATAPGPWAATLKEEVYLRWIEAFESQHPEMSGEPMDRYLELRAKLGQDIEARRALFVRELSLELSNRARRPVLPPGEHHPNRRPDTDWRKLEYEFTKQRRIRSVRRLLEEFGFPFRRVAPCWLASPEAVSDVFPLERGSFDLVIFDESSQLAVERALPAIYRGKRVVIAGDEKQLRPFDLFRLAEDEEDEDDDAEGTAAEAESLLVLAMRIFPPQYLSWHYRSKFQELIDFSNHAFYAGNLEIAANVERTPAAPPIEFVKVKGLWEDRRNAVEAERVVDVLKGLLVSGEKDGRTPTLGVIAFNEAQRDQVLDAIDARRASDAEFDRLWGAADAPDRLLDERPFVKNLENVQGDERDIILFTVGYAPGRDGKLRVQFGPLNLMGGENRLNVAVTRARQRIIVVASFEPKDLPVEGTLNEGPKRLKDYLLYAQATSALQASTVRTILTALDPNITKPREPLEALPFDVPLETQLAQALEGIGHKVERRVGYSNYRLDLAVVHPNDPQRYLLGIECDGATFHSARSARERDVARQQFLEAHGWTIDRVWSRNWWKDRERELARINARVAELAVIETPKPR